MAGYRSSISVGKIGSGDELFSTLCALNVAGAGSVMMSRWPVGGESTAIALRELLQELPFVGISQSWKRAREVLRRSELDPEAEPLLAQSDHNIEGLTGSQPLFWSGYMISSLPHKEVKQDAKPEVMKDAEPKAMQEAKPEMMQKAKPEVMQEAKPEAMQEAMQEVKP